VVRDPDLHALWINTVAEPKAVKNRVHLDVHATSPDVLVDLGATVVGEVEGFSVLQDPGGNELCVFPDDGAAPGVARPFALCIDSADPVQLARWWHGLLGGRIGDGPDGRPRWLHGGAGFGEIVMTFVPVEDRRVVKKSCHWDVTTDDVEGLVAVGATLVRAPDDEISWTVLADVQGNEFCAFTA
jgi:hypothetical protein